jgi:hypothetical protein
MFFKQREINEDTMMSLCKLEKKVERLENQLEESRSQFKALLNHLNLRISYIGEQPEHTILKD